MRQALLDANILSYFLKGDPPIVAKVNDYLQYHSHLTISIFTYYETKRGLIHRDASRQMAEFEQLVEIIDIVPFSEEVADVASNIYSQLRQQGDLVASLDLLIGATAVYHNYLLITANVKHFKNIPGLQYENWLA